MNQRTIILAALLSACAAPRPQVAQPELVGPWRGVLVAGAARLEVVLHIASSSDGYDATFDSVSQGVRDIPVASLARAGDQVTALIPAIGAEFTAKIIRGADAAMRLEGAWRQGGHELPLTLKPGDARPPRRPQLPGQEVPYEREEVAFGHDPAQSLEASFAAGAGAPVTLCGTLTLPRSPGPHPVAVMITGSGPQDRDESLVGHKPFLVIADHLTRRGVAVLRYDDRGTGASTGDFLAGTTPDFAVDARAALRYLRTREDIDHARMGLIGHSEGGLIAPMVATGPDRAMVSFAVLLAPPAVGICEIITRQTELVLRANGDTEENIAFNNAMTRAALEALRANRDDDAARAAAMRAVAEEYWPRLPAAAREQAENGVADVIATLATLDTPWMNWIAHYDPAPALRAMRCDVLAVFGGKDLQVEPAQNRPPLEAALAANAEVVTLDGLNHLFQTAETGSPAEYHAIEETFAPAALELVGEWVVARTRR